MTATLDPPPSTPEPDPEPTPDRRIRLDVYLHVVDERVNPLAEYWTRSLAKQQGDTRDE